MIKQKIIVRNPEGLHLRPAAVFAEEMGKFNCDVNVRFKKNTVNAKSLLSILSACIVCGSEISIECDGSDEQEAMKKAIDLIDSEFRDK